MTEFTIPQQLESQRLILRMFREGDWRSMHAHCSNPECTRYTLGRVLAEGESWRQTATLAGHWLLRGYAPYALAVGASFERETDFRGRRFPVFRHAFPAEGRPTA